ncbi:putative deoxyribonuclease YjjV [Methylibium sp. T29]|nr:putative deoxyribonuclease YjjV [Methylibium sp. T29]
MATPTVPAGWTDTHCHLDAPEFDADRTAVVERARHAGVTQIVLPAVAPFDFDTVRDLAHRHGLAYALGVHPMYTGPLDDAALDALREALAAHRDDPRLVAVGEIGLDHFVPGLDRAKQEHFYVQQLAMAREAGLPVLLHVRRSADSCSSTCAACRRSVASHTRSTAAPSRRSPSWPRASSSVSGAR